MNGLYDISNVKIIPPEYVKKGMSFVFRKGEESEGSDIDDLILISIGLLAFVIILTVAYLFTKKF